MARMKGADVARMYGASTPTNQMAEESPTEEGSRRARAESARIAKLATVSTEGEARMIVSRLDAESGIPAHYKLVGGRYMVFVHPDYAIKARRIIEGR